MWRPTPNGLSACGAPRHPARSVLASTPSTALALGAKVPVALNNVLITGHNELEFQVFQEPPAFPEVARCRPGPQRPSAKPGRFPIAAPRACALPMIRFSSDA